MFGRKTKRPLALLKIIFDPRSIFIGKGFRGYYDRQTTKGVKMETVHQETKNGLEIKIFQDEHGESPKDWGDENLFLCGFHRSFWVDPIDQELAKAIANQEQDNTEVEEYREKYHIFGLEAYIHGGVSLSLSQEGSFPDRQWDVSQLGLVFVSKKEWEKREDAEERARGLISTWNEYLSGNVYGFVIETPEGEEIDSCWGFYGDYEKNALEEAKSVIDNLTNKGTTDHKGQMLFPF